MNECILVEFCLGLNFIVSKWWGFPVGSVVKNPPANAGDMETWVQSLGPEDPLERVMATHSNILVWEIPWTEEPRELQSMGLQKGWT